ncbi:MAG TPA: DUF4142 domain-containing protein [Polyangiaceae bacterium]|nr:DUF4142 domain-containing protein [Polyangiaceae bacterium]
MFSYRAIVCVVVTLPFAGCDRNDTHARPDTAAVTAGAPATRTADPADGSPGTDSLGRAAPVSTGTTTAPAGNDPQAEALDDQQIAAITQAANEGEIAQAKVAQTKARNAKVKAFAAKMIAHHSQAKEKQSKLDVGSTDGPVSKKLQNEGAATLASLNSTPAGPEFDQTYMRAQIDGHQKVLDTINTRLLPSVKNEKLATYVKDLKPTVETHLKEARDIEQLLAPRSLSATAGSGGSPNR